jgi:L-asparagine transporter-like permease
LIALVIVLTVNMISVKLFGEMEFWAALIKVVAPVTFLVVDIVFLAGRITIEGQSTGVSVISDNDGIARRRLVRRKGVLEMAPERVAETPLMVEFLEKDAKG